MSVQRILVMVILKTGKEVEAWLECRDHGCDLRFFKTNNGGEIDADTVKDWVLRLPTEGKK